MIEQLNHLGDGGIALGIVTGAVLIIYLLAGVARLWLEVARENNAARNTNDAKKTAVDEQQNAVLKEVAAQLQVTRASQETLGPTLLQIAQVLREHDTRAHLVLEKMDAASNEMREASQRRDNTSEQQHREVLERLERQQKQLEDLTREIKVRDLSPEIRGEIAKLVRLASNIAADVKKFTDRSEPGEASKDPETEKSVEHTNEENAV